MKKTKKRKPARERDEISAIHGDLSRLVKERRTRFDRARVERKAIAAQKRPRSSLREPRATLDVLLAEIDLRAAESLEREVLVIVEHAARKVDEVEREARAAIAAEFATHRASRALQRPPQSKPPKGVKPELHKLITQAQYATAAVIGEVARLRVELAVIVNDPTHVEDAVTLNRQLEQQLAIAERLKKCLRSMHR